MANSRKKISELPALSVASLDTTFVLGISGSTTYKISINNLTSSLDTTFATDLVTATLSSSLDGKLSISSFNSYTASAINGTISGSSQLTSSFDTRYVVSGSITQTTWDNIANKPAGIVSQSTDLSSLNTFTASISTASLVNRLNAIESVSGSWITESETGSFLTSLSGAISSSTQISDLGFVTGSYTTINSFNSLTQSFNSISQSFNVISGSVGTVDFNGVVSSSAQITAFGFISSSQTIDSGSLVTTSSFNSYTASISTASLVTSISNLNTFTASVTTASIVTSITNLNTFTASISTASLVTSISNLNTATSSYLTSLSGAISSSSQLTSSFDTRYVASGSISAVPAGTISGSSQLTSSFDTRYAASGSVSSNINTASLATTGSNSFNGNQTITGSLVVGSVAVVNGGITIPTGSVISLTSGSSLFVDTSGSITGSLTGSVFGIGDVVAFSASVNSRIISGSSVAGTISGSSQLTSSYDGRYLTIGGDSVISGSSQLTSSFDTRYAISASFVSSSNLSSIQTITSASYAALTPVSGTLYIIIG